MRNKFFTRQEEALIIEAISKAETGTTGEIKVHIEETCDPNVLDRAAKIFSSLGIHKKSERNGVLIYIAFKKKSFAVLGDKGINALVDEEYWDLLRDCIQKNFKKGDFSKGLCDAVHTLGKTLKQHFSDNGKVTAQPRPDETDCLHNVSA